MALYRPYEHLHDSWHPTGGPGTETTSGRLVGSGAKEQFFCLNTSK